MSGEGAAAWPGRSLAATLAAAWLAALAGLLFGMPGLALLALLLATVAALGARVPHAARTNATLGLPARSPAEGEEVPVALRLENQGRHPLLAEWRLVLPGLSRVVRGQTAGEAVVGSGEGVDLDSAIAFEMFGLNRVGPAEIRLQDAFGFVVAERIVCAPVEMRVYPRRDRLHDAPLRARQKRTVMGAYEVPQQGDGFEFYGLRDYSVGDRPRDINWKASARVGHMVVNQHQKENDAEIVLLVDARAPSRVGRLSASPFAQSCRAAVAVAEAHLRTRDAVKFVAYGATLHQDNHTGAARHVQGILDLVVGLEPAGELTLADTVKHLLPSLRPGSPVLVFSGLVGDPTVAEALSVLRSHHFPVKVISPQAAWGDATPAPLREAWEAEHARQFQLVQGVGVPAARAGAGLRLEESVAHLGVHG